MKRWSRKLHRWSAIVVAVPTLLVILTGLLLQLKKEFAWIQPPTVRGASTELAIKWERILEITSRIPETNVDSWEDIDRLDVRPSKGVVKVRCKSGWEVQIDSSDATILSKAYRRSDFIESLHDGSFFSDGAKRYLFFANGLVLLGLWLTGMYLWYLPIQSRRRKQKRMAQKPQSSEPKEA